MTILEAAKERFPNAEELHGHGENSAVIEWGSVVYVITESEVEKCAAFLGVYSKENWKEGGESSFEHDYATVVDGGEKVWRLAGLAGR